MRPIASRAAAAVVLLAAASRADAIPAFARKYAMSCTACHVAWPILNQVGTNFRDEGYQFGLGKDEPNAQPPGYLPIALRTLPQYSYTRTTNQESAGGPVTTAVGGVPLPGGVDILTAGTITRDVSFLLVLAGFAGEEPAGVESAWVRFNRLGGSPWANVKVGKLELDQPASSHRPISQIAGYAAYDPFPFSNVAFNMGDNQVGVELDGHNARSTTRYSVSLTSANLSAESPASRGVWSAPMLYGHLQHAYELGGEALSWLRVGVLGAVGWWPTAFTLDPSGAEIPGTGAAHKKFSRLGAEISGTLGNPATPAFFTLAYIRGMEDAGLGSTDPSGADLSLQSNSFNGGFLEVTWVPFAEPSENATPWAVFGRVDLVRYQRGAGDVTGGTLGARRYLAFGPRASAAIHLEVHVDRVKGTGAADPLSGQPRNVDTQAFMAGVDFDF